MTALEVLAISVQAVQPRLFAHLADQILRVYGLSVHDELGLPRPSRRRDDRRRQFRSILGGRR